MYDTKFMSSFCIYFTMLSLIGSLKHGKGLEDEIIWGDHFSNVKKLDVVTTKRAKRAI